MAIVWLVTANNFNSWTQKTAEKYGYIYPPRYYTTFIRFRFYQDLYIFAMMAGYVLLVYAPELLEALGTISPSQLEKFSNNSFLWGALIITGVIPNFPVIQKAENMLRDTLQEWAFIPFEAQRIMAVLKDEGNAFAPKLADIEKVRSKIGRDKNRESDFTNNRTDLPRHKWCKLSYLYMMITRLRKERLYIKFFGSCGKQLYKNLEKDYRNLKKDIEQRLAIIEQNNQADKEGKLIAPVREETMEKLDTLLDSCYKLISCGILTTAKLQKNRDDAFEMFGLRSKPFEGTRSINWNMVLKSCMVVFLSAFLPTILYYHAFKIMKITPDIYPASGLEALLWSVVGLMMFGIGLVGSILVERVVLQQNSRNWRERKWDEWGDPENITLHCCYSAVIGYGIGLCVISIYTLLESKGQITAGQGKTILLYPLIPAATSYLVTHFMETPRDLFLKKYSRRTAETFSLFILNMSAAILVLLTIYENIDPWSFLYVVLTAGLIGAGIGYTFIEPYRHYLSPQKDRRREPRYEVEENASLIHEDISRPCKVLSVSPSFACVNIPVHRHAASMRLAFPSIGDIPVVISQRRNTVTVLRFLKDALSEENLNAYLARMKGLYSHTTGEAVQAV